MHAIASMKRAWRSFARAEAGQRFIQHYRRAQLQRSIVVRTLRIGLGIALTVVGVLLWFLPGPGTLLVVFGLAMFAGESRLVAAYLDRAEVFLRARLERLRRWWQTASV